MLHLTPLIPLLSLLITLTPTSAQYTATYSVGSLPDKSEGDGQTGTNSCGTTASQTSTCQNVYLNAVDDFCLWGSPDAPGSAEWGTKPVGSLEEIVVSYCLKDGYGTRLIPSGTISSAHFVKVVSDKVSYVQITGNADLTKIGLMANDDGGELDPHSWTGLGNPQGGLVFSNAFTGQYEQIHEWTSFPSASAFCIRGCRDGANAAAYCEHIYDVLGCGFTIPGSYDPGFDNCNGDPTDEAPGVYGGSTFSQGDASTPAAHAAGATSQCTPVSTIGGGTANLAAVTGVASSSSASNSSASVSSTMSSSNSTSASQSSSKSGSASSGSGSSMVTSKTGSASAGASVTAAPSSSGGSAVNAASASASSKSAGEKVAIFNFGMGSLTGVMVGVIGAAIGGVAVFA